MLNVQERENVILQQAAAAKKAGRKLYIYGAAVGGKAVYDALIKNMISPDGFCVDSQYYKANQYFCGLPIVSVDALGGGEICTVLVACMTKKTVLGNNEKIDFVNEDFVSLYSPLRIEYSFFNEHKEVFAKLYDTLGDEKSKQCMNAFLNQRISGKFEYLDHMWLENQYFDKELINLKNISCIVDCGAYDGDTFRAFCENYKADSGKSYEGKAILLEPAKNNYEKLVNNFSSKENIVILQLGAWNEKTVLCFEENVYEPTACRFSEEGEMSVLVDKIDNIVLPQDKVDFIKMDIEGSELNALRGAENAIRKDKPLLAICVYHKKEDLITIPQYIKSLYSGYRLYLRSYEKYCRELVLYAIPD